MINGSEMSQSGDKGVSIGENSLLFTVDSRFLDNHIAIESKDASNAVIYNSRISGNDIGVHAYQKNWQYGTGGRLTVGNSVIENNLKTSQIGKASEVAILDSYIDEVPVTGKLPSLVQTDSRYRDHAQSSSPLNVENIDEFLKKHMSLIDNKIRGVFTQ